MPCLLAKCETFESQSSLYQIPPWNRMLGLMTTDLNLGGYFLCFTFVVIKQQYFQTQNCFNFVDLLWNYSKVLFWPFISSFYILPLSLVFAPALEHGEEPNRVLSCPLTCHSKGRGLKICLSVVPFKWKEAKNTLHLSFPPLQSTSETLQLPSKFT